MPNPILKEWDKPEDRNQKNESNSFPTDLEEIIKRAFVVDFELTTIEAKDTKSNIKQNFMDYIKVVKVVKVAAHERKLI